MPSGPENPSQPDLFIEERLISLTQATKLFPDRRPSIPTVWRWCRKGVRGIQLEYIKAGRRLYTSVEAVERFCQALARLDPNPMPRPRPHSRKSRSATQRDRDVETARTRLETEGF